MDIDNLEITKSPGLFPHRDIITKDNGIEIIVSPDMTATIRFDPAITLPDEYTFTHHATYKQFVAVAEYLKEKYKDFIEMDKPQVNIHGGDYSIYLEQSYDIELYDGSGNIVNQIINYNFNRVAFYGNDSEKLWLARVWQPDLSGKVGDYPIITTEEAKELLRKGNYITTVTERFPELEKYVAKIELQYRTGIYEQYFMPYYYFLVELPAEEFPGIENGLKTYGAYYVPAVKGEYLSNMPVWDGSFN